ncbi:MAG: HAMP domain-containing histidine kinase [Ignavibacteriales bacterium]|nr:HAMP domain-containing histidine kinase [Ignavibacteriales bacterium]
MRIVLPFHAEQKCQQCHDVAEGYVLGAASMEIPFSHPMGAIRANAVRSFAFFIALTIAVTIVGAFVFRRFVARPISRLVHATEVIGGGNLDHELVEEFGHDELGKLAASFEEMQVKLKAVQSELIQKERLSAIGQMASGIVHDFRNPMTNISMGLALLQSTPLADEQRLELYKELQDAIQRMSQMTQELLDFSRGDVRMEKRPIPVSLVVEEIASSVEGHLLERDIKLDVAIDSHRVCSMDKDRLQRTLINIINNAEDALPDGGNIRLGVHEHNESIVFTVQDDGTGIPEHIRLRLFEPFVTTGKKSGTGLGLAITKRLVEQHGGKVEFESTNGKGTTFSVRIPVTGPSASVSESHIMQIHPSLQSRA